MTSPLTPDTQGRRGGSARWKTTLGFGAAVLLLLGATWRGAFTDGATAAAAGADQNAPATVHAQQAPAGPTLSRSLAGGRDSYADIVKTVAPSVVNVRATGRTTPQATGMPQMPDELFRRFFGPDSEQGPGQRRMPRNPRSRAVGSGVIVSADGYVLTNNHITDGATEISIEMTDGRSLPAKLVGADKPSDLALLKVQATGLTPIALGNSDAAQVGDVVLAVGNPLNLGQTVTMGIISAKGRSTSAGDSYEDFIQTDAPINHGNSGGALVDMKGQLLGITSQILTPSDGNIGIGFAIPVNMARSVMDQLRAGGKVHRSQLGVTVQQLTSDLAETMGVKATGGAVIGSVSPGSAAERAGLKRGDVILSFNGQPVRDTNTLRNRVAETKPGSSANVVINRDGREQTVNVTLAEATESRGPRGGSDEGESTEDNSGSALGLSVTPVSPDMPRRGSMDRMDRMDRSGRSRGGDEDVNVAGLLVQDVDPDGRAADAGIQPGDVIVEVNKQPVRTVEQLKTASRAKSDKPMLFLVNRDGRDLFLTVKPAS
jgi:serine protease Do